ncbi:MAG: cobalamin-binding protein [Alphaproteobacteria bacterium]|nr:cobalamin-binding protein [Alphaproteobacteria bacterium]
MADLSVADPLIDAVGTAHSAAPTNARIVSLVPSITELLFDLGLGSQVVGRTHFCVHPADAVEKIASVGGTKKISARKLAALNPTHVILNIEENTLDLAKKAAELAPQVIVTYPKKPTDNRQLFALIGGIFGRAAEAAVLTDRFNEALATLTAAAGAWPQQRAYYFVWRDPWMAVSRDTYIAEFLALARIETLPAAAIDRYPKLIVSEALLRGADLVLLPSEPYEFGPSDVAAFHREFPTAPPVRLIDGQMVSWYGSRAVLGLDYLRAFGATLAALN